MNIAEVQGKLIDHQDKYIQQLKDTNAKAVAASNAARTLVHMYARENARLSRKCVTIKPSVN